MIRSHRIRLYPNTTQEQVLIKSCGVARFAYNWALARWNEKYKNKERVNRFILNKEFNSIKKKDFPWTGEVTKCAPAAAIIDLQHAFNKFFKKKANYPRFKKKGKKDSFKINNDCFSLVNNLVRVPKLLQPIKMAEKLRYNGKVLSGVVYRKANKWFISIVVEMSDLINTNTENQSVGIDLGINTAVTTSDGETFVSPKPLGVYDKQMRRQQRILDRKKLGSSNWKKQAVRVSNLHLKIFNIRNDWNHKVTSYLAKKYNSIFLENLNSANMMKNKKMAHALVDVSFGYIKQQLSYKTNVVKVSRWFPSSKLCYNCGYKKETLLLSEREYVCEKCGYRNDRDLNAALNIHREGLSQIQACGHDASTKEPSSLACDVDEAGINKYPVRGDFERQKEIKYFPSKELEIK